MESPSATYPPVPATAPGVPPRERHRSAPAGGRSGVLVTVGWHRGRTRRDEQVDTASTHGVAPTAAPFRHDALFFGSPDELAAGTVPFVQEGLAADRKSTR